MLCNDDSKKLYTSGNYIMDAFYRLSDAVR